MIIREALPSDAAVMARVHVDSWRTTYTGIVPQTYLDQLSYPQREQRWRSSLSATDKREFGYVAVDEADQVVGFAWGGPERTANPKYQGELYVLYLLQKYQRQGAGTRLVSCIVENLLEQNVQSMLVWVLANNTPARRFYAALGGNLINLQPTTIGGVELWEIAYGWPDLDGLAAN